MLYISNASGSHGLRGAAEVGVGPRNRRIMPENRETYARCASGFEFFVRQWGFQLPSSRMAASEDLSWLLVLEGSGLKIQ